MLEINSRAAEFKRWTSSRLQRLETDEKTIVLELLAEVEARAN